jgi:hypothetical protein
MNQHLTPLIIETLDHFRRLGKLPTGYQVSMSLEESHAASERFRDLFKKSQSEDQGEHDKDLRPGYILRHGEAAVQQCQFEGDFGEGRYERHTLLGEKGQFTEMMQTKGDTLRVLEAYWNPKEATFVAYHLDRLQAQRSTITAWQFAERRPATNQSPMPPSNPSQP